MPRRLQPEKQLELDSLYGVVAVITEWYDDLASGDLRGQWTAVMRRAYEDRDLRGMRMAYNDLVEMTKAADTEQRRDLDARLRARANTSVALLHNKTAQRVERIRTRGKITSEEQYYLVREYVAFSHGTPEMEAEAQQLFKMLHDFEARFAAQAKRRGSPGSKPADP